MTHRLGGVPQQGFVEQDPVLAAQVHSDLALDYLSQLQDHCVWMLPQHLRHSMAHARRQVRSRLLSPPKREGQGIRGETLGLTLQSARGQQARAPAR